MSLTMERMCGFLSVVCQPSNTSALPSINWKLKNSAIILNKWQANSYSTLMIKHGTSFSTFFVTKLDGGCVPVNSEWEGGSLSGCSNKEIIALPAEPSKGEGGVSWSVTLVFCWIPGGPLSSARSKEDNIAQSPKDLLSWGSIKSERHWTHAQDRGCEDMAFIEGSVVN